MANRVKWKCEVHERWKMLLLPLFCTREREGERWEAEKRERKGGVGVAKGDGREKRVTVREKEKERGGESCIAVPEPG